MSNVAEGQLGVSPFRVYGADELGRDGYPPEWHKLPESEYADLLNAADMVLPGGIKDVVCALADYRCVRCQHPYRGGGEWSACDHECSHRGPVRMDYWVDGEHVVIPDHRLATEAGVVVGYGKTVEARWRILTVHHLTGNKADCRWWNLASLCQRCHLEIQGRVRMEQVFPYEHSFWFKPYAAGYYAATYLGEDLTRDETLARLDELLALELAA